MNKQLEFRINKVVDDYLKRSNNDSYGECYILNRSDIQVMELPCETLMMKEQFSLFLKNVVAKKFSTQAIIVVSPALISNNEKIEEDFGKDSELLNISLEDLEKINTKYVDDILLVTISSRGYDAMKIYWYDGDEWILSETADSSTKLESRFNYLFE